MAKFHVINGEAQASPPERLPLRDLAERVAVALEDAELGASRAVDLLAAQAALHGASDAHFEPWQDCMVVRLRIDGMLHEVARIPKPQQERVIARIKILARMVVYQKDAPQDGRMDAAPERGSVAIRVATFPTVYGEKATLRLLGAQPELERLDELGFQPAVTEGLRGIIARPQGALLLTGPSSSGKTTTIYALLRELTRVRPAAHVVTIEDPVERRLGNVSQTEIRPHAGFTYQAALRAILRQDPEVIVLGEIRDAETARMAVQAGLTGHLVISTIHSGTAAGVFTRLLDMGVEPYLAASSVTGVLAQRLVRRRCPACAGAGGATCAVCQGIGYAGRTAIGELLLVNEDLRDLVLERPRTRRIHDAAIEAGMVPLLDDGRVRVRDGVTTEDELARVVMPEEDEKK